jgi:Arc/MetJ-type ribon-helix-helix transcriptional regulator
MRTKSVAKTQVTVRISADHVAYIDQLVSEGRVESRAAFLDQAAERQRRWGLGLRDLAILSHSTGEKDDLDGVAEWAARTPLDID